MGSCSTLSYNLTSLIIILLASLPSISSVKCFSNIQKFQAEEECGPNGYCFSFNGTDRVTYARTIRGCDNSFICEVMISNITEEIEYPVGELKDSLFGYPNYCAYDVTIRPAQEKREMVGTLCCCNEDWCNVNYVNEPINDFSRIFELDSGTVEDYIILKHVAEKYGIH